MRLLSDVCMVWRSGFDEDAGARANTAALLAEMYRYPIADESNGVFLLVYVFRNVCQMWRRREYSISENMRALSIVQLYCIMLAFSTDHLSKQGTAQQFVHQ